MEEKRGDKEKKSNNFSEHCLVSSWTREQQQQSIFEIWSQSVSSLHLACCPLASAFIEK